MRQWAMSLLVLGFAVMSLVMLRSIAPELVFRQTLAFALGGLCVFFATRFSFETAEKLSAPLYWIMIFALLLLLVIGAQTRGTAGWFELPGGFKLQPSQFMIPIASLFLLTHCDLKKNYTKLKP